MEGDHEARRTGRRNLLRGAALTAASMGAPSLAGCATAASAQRSGVIQAPVGGSDEPYPIPWLDKNGSHNQAGPGLEPSSIYHFKGRIARAAEFIGSGVDGAGNRLAFGSRTTDNSFMQASAGPRKGWRVAERGRTSDSRSPGDRLSPRTRCTTFTPQSGRADCTGCSTYRRARSRFRLTAGRRPCG